MIEKKKRGRPRTLPDLHCEQCGKSFRPYTSGSRFCSRACFGRWHSERGTFRAKKDAKVCPACSKTFYVGGLGSRRAQKFCSAVCAGKQRAPKPRSMSTTERAWLAGVFDGEGCICEAKRGRARSLRITVTNTSYPLLERIQEVAGTGAIIDHRRKPHPRHSRTWYWQVYSDNARELLRQMLPWLIVKREKAEEAIADARVQ